MEAELSMVGYVLLVLKSIFDPHAANTNPPSSVIGARLPFFCLNVPHTFGTVKRRPYRKLVARLERNGKIEAAFDRDQSSHGGHQSPRPVPSESVTEPIEPNICVRCCEAGPKAKCVKDEGSINCTYGNKWGNAAAAPPGS